MLQHWYTRTYSKIKGPVHTSPGELENVVLLWKRIKCFPSTLRRNLILKRNNQRSFWICVRSANSYDYSDAIVFEKLPLFLRSESVRKAAFSWRTGVDCRPYHINKLRFQVSPAQCKSCLSVSHWERYKLVPLTTTLSVKARSICFAFTHACLQYVFLEKYNKLFRNKVNFQTYLQL